MLKRCGFSIIELIVAIAIIVILTAVIFIAVDPAKRLAKGRNAERWQVTKSILKAIKFYQVDNKGSLPSGIDTTLRMLGTDGSGCNVNCGGGIGSGNIVDDTQAEFGAGIYSDTQWDGVNFWVELTALGQTNGSGNYSSEIKNVGGSVSWDSISWVPERPIGKELPNNAQSETVYNSGNANMTGNVLLMHMNETSGTIVDSSGQGNNGTQFGGATYGVQGKLNTALSFDGLNDYVDLGTGLNSTLNGDFTFSAWIYPKANNILIFGNKGTSGSRSIAVDIWDVNKITIAEESIAVIGGASYSGLNQWIHVVWTFNKVSSTHKLYINGVLGNTLTYSFSGNYTGSSFISDNNENPFNGTIDEVAIWNRVLSPTEVFDIYKRGVLKLKYQVRSCDDNACSGEIFIGPNGTSGDYYEWGTTNSTSTPTFNLTNVANNQYFQYKTFFETDNSSYSPELKSVTVNYSGSGSGEVAASACLDLSSYLVDEYLPEIPQDPKNGSAGKTYYAVKKSGQSGIKIVSCSAELNENINAQR